MHIKWNLCCTIKLTHVNSTNLLKMVLFLLLPQFIFSPTAPSKPGMPLDLSQKNTDISDIYSHNSTLRWFKLNTVTFISSSVSHTHTLWSCSGLWTVPDGFCSATGLSSERGGQESGAERRRVGGGRVCRKVAVVFSLSVRVWSVH